MAQFNLDVAFSSDTTPNDSTQPIAMAYGYTNNTSGSFKGAGQTKESLPPNSTVVFSIFDTAPSSAFTINSVTISAANKRPGQGQSNSPFSDSVWSTGTITASSNPNGPNATQLGGPQSGVASTGCNVQGKNWWVGTFTIGNVSGQSFEITVTVVGSVNGTTKQFKVDPEMVVTENK